MGRPGSHSDQVAINPNLSDDLAWCGMVTRRRLRTVLNAFALYTLAALLIGYFGVNAYNGDRGLKAKEDIDRQMAALTADLERLQTEQAQWERRIALLKSDDLDPDMLDERVRALLDYADAHDLTLMLARPSPTATPPKP
ncbi:MAG TPA: septum formation initiator family protein [Xanthobacteraceae bacterium]|jgi:cell division protein FtsB|nr:septum formation initiator family protein [Xanthobacteraceae bacterium]